MPCCQRFKNIYQNIGIVCTLKGTCQYTVQRVKAMYVCVKMILKGSKENLNSFNCYSCYSSRKSQKWCLRLLCNTAYRVTQFVTHVERVESVLCIQWPLAPARREGYCVSLPSWGFSCSPLVSLRRQLY